VLAVTLKNQQRRNEMKTRWILALGACLAAVIVGGASGASPASLTGVTTLSGGNVILYEGGVGTAHQLHGVIPAVQNALVALAGKSVTVDGTFDQPSLPNSPILVQDFRVLPGGALNGESVTITGPVRMVSDGGVIIDDQYGNGHRLDSTSAVSAATIAAFANRQATVQGTANVTNPSSYINWPIEVASIS
jgi:hypothetical protein